MTFGRFFNSTFVSTDRRFVYVKNDKAGSSFIIRSLTRSEKRLRRIRHRTPFLNRQVNPLLTPAELTPRQWQRALARYFVFTFSRNPFSRTLSCYLDRIVGRDKILLRPAEEDRLRRGFRPSFAEFLEMLGQDGVLDLDTHWKPQYRNIATDYFNYGLSAISRISASSSPPCFSGSIAARRNSAKCAREPPQRTSSPTIMTTGRPGWSRSL